MKLTETEKAYLAGFFDGEGCIGLYERSYKSHKHYNSIHEIWIGLANTDFNILSWVKEKVPFGKIRFKPEGRRKDGHYTKLAWELRIRNKKEAHLFLSTIRPYLIVKAEQADLLLSLLNAEQGTKRGQGVKTPPELLSLRREVSTKLKQLKSNQPQSIH